jgi:hypothetical protein
MVLAMSKVGSWPEPVANHLSSRGGQEMIPLALHEPTVRMAAVALVVAGVLAGCAITTPGAPVAPLELVSSGPVVLPANCVPGDGVVYRTSFVVQRDGRVADITAAPGAGCVQQALREWIATFQYRPVAEAIPAEVDWMAVTAVRGG